MKLSKRLLAIADMINDGDIVYDIGCDHALLDIYLTKKYKKIKCFACDVNENALSMAKKNILLYNLTDKIETKVSNGIDDIKIMKNSIIVISGMGANTMMQILENSQIFLAKKIILQSNNDLYKLRKYMVKKGYKIEEEITILDKGKYYVIISFVLGNANYKKLNLLIGPKIVEYKDKNKEYLYELLKKEKNIYKKIPLKHFVLKLKSYIKIKKIMAVLK